MDGQSFSLANRFVPRGSLKKINKEIIKTFRVKILQNSVCEMIIFYLRQFRGTFLLKKGFLGEFCIKVDIFDGSITAQWAKIG